MEVLRSDYIPFTEEGGGSPGEWGDGSSTGVSAAVEQALREQAVVAQQQRPNLRQRDIVHLCLHEVPGNPVWISPVKLGGLMYEPRYRHGLGDEMQQYLCCAKGGPSSAAFERSLFDSDQIRIFHVHQMAELPSEAVERLAADEVRSGQFWVQPIGTKGYEMTVKFFEDDNVPEGYPLRRDGEAGVEIVLRTPFDDVGGLEGTVDLEFFMKWHVSGTYITAANFVDEHVCGFQDVSTSFKDNRLRVTLKEPDQDRQHYKVVLWLKTSSRPNDEVSFDTER